MRLWMWHRTAMQQPAGATRDLHMHAWLESVQAGQISHTGRSTGPVARYRLVHAWPSKLAAGLARWASGLTVDLATIPLAVQCLWRVRGSDPPPPHTTSPLHLRPAFHDTPC